MKVRVAGMADLPLLASHWMLCVAENETQTAKPDVARYAAWLKSKMNEGSAMAVLAVEGRRVVGSMVMWLREVQPLPEFELGRIPYLMSAYVEPRCRRRGHARAMAESLLETAREQGYPFATLHADEAGRRLAAGMGWKPGAEMRIRLEAERHE